MNTIFNTKGVIVKALEVTMDNSRSEQLRPKPGTVAELTWEGIIEPYMTGFKCGAHVYDYGSVVLLGDNKRVIGIVDGAVGAVINSTISVKEETDIDALAATIRSLDNKSIAELFTLAFIR